MSGSRTLTASPRACNGQGVMRRLSALLALAPPPVGEAPPADTVAPAASASASAVAAAPEAPLACPAGMKLVDGDYCSELDHKCRKSWYDKSNKKTICEEFEPGSASCTGSKVPKRYCIDDYEWPNKKGEGPEGMNPF